MMTVDEAFKAGLALVRDAGMNAKGNDMAVLVAHSRFQTECKRIDTMDERFPTQGPLHARKLILLAYSL